MKSRKPDRVLQLRHDHTWKAKPGYQIFVADRGALSLWIPADWIWSKDQDSFKFRDREPPDDRCTLAVSLWRIAEVVKEISLADLVTAALEGDRRAASLTGDGSTKGEVVSRAQGPLELAWGEVKFLDPNERREAVSRLCLARAGGYQTILTLDFWPEDASWVVPIWEDVLASLELDRVIHDPSSGPRQH